MGNLTISRSDLDEAKDRLRIPELWRILQLPGEPPTRDGVKFSSPLRPDAHPSCSFYDDCRRMKDWSQGKSYDGVAIVGEALGLKNGDAIHRFVELANGRPVTVRPVHLAEPKPKPQMERPILSGFVKGTRAELQRIADSRKIDVRAAGAKVDCFHLRELKTVDGKPVKDLNDCCELEGSQAAELLALFP